MLEILNEIRRCKNHNLKGILATIVSVQGSTYQKEGAKCFLSEDGKLTGLLSGGCVENDITEHGKEVIETGQAKRIYYDFRNDGDSIWGLGLGCNGAMDIFLELYDPCDEERSSKIENIFSINKPTWVATITKSNDSKMVGEKYFINSENQLNEICTTFPDIKSACSGKNLPERAQLLSISEDHRNIEVFLDYLEPVPTLALFGAGPDAVPVVAAAKAIGWRVKVIDHRPAYLTKENFPQADELSLIKPGHVPDVAIDENTYSVIMSHHFLQDQLALEKLLLSSAAYIGILGPKTRTNALLEPTLMKYNSENLDLTRIFSPIGLNINAKTPGEIAQSIISELIAVHRKSNHVHSLKKSETINNIESSNNYKYQLHL
ncbi:XdhC family protein [Bacillus sp. Marseille-P3661]|uniref:XdhC family protein n=1 Tax=Bacillus sp. Marseille-P3661 TaxID=1936234 RepID=UPI000C83BA36|nr:XdhC/CoxI family protein [Bacillus sp. Marseille-P3661]